MAKDNTELKIKFLDYYAALPNKTLAAQYIGKSLDTINRWEELDPEFAVQVNNKAAEWAKTNAGKVHSKEWLLERVMNDHFGQRTKQDITSGGEKLETVLVKFLDGKDDTNTGGV